MQADTDSESPQGSHISFPLHVSKSTPKQVGFTQLPSSDTGIRFINKLAGDAFLTDAVAHNGSGVALGDVNQDGWVDVYLCNLQGPNQLYLNQGNWKFLEKEMGLASCAKQRSTAASLVDLDGDQDLDLLVNGIATGTRLFLNDGQGSFHESNQSGLSKTASPSSMAVADIDQDGDLDLYCAHYIDVMHIADPTTDYALSNRNGQYVVTHVNGEPTTIPRLKNRFMVSKSGRLRELPETDGLYLNNGQGQFKPIQFLKGTFNSQNGKPVQPPRDWSLAVMFRDLNQDGSPDIYVCTDNASPDRIWINNGNGTFNALPPSGIRHTSRSSMGMDAADINRDGIDDFFVVDMFARSHEKRMTQLAKQHSSSDIIQHIYGQPRYNRNTLFVGREDGTFSETALMAGVAATDWSWCPVFLDVDLDGYEDLLVTNGFSFDVMDQDSQDQLRTMQLSKFDRKRSRQFHPPFITKNASFRNLGDGTFKPTDEAWGFDIQGISYGMAIGDLDNDGDLDAFINQLNEEALVLRNDCTSPRVKVSLEGPTLNPQGIGASIRLVNQSLTQSQTMHAGGRYLSSDEPSRVFAVKGKASESTNLEVTWPNQRVTVIPDIEANRHYVVRYSEKDPITAQNTSKIELTLFEDASHLLNFKHQASARPTPMQPAENRMVEPNAPSICWLDINKDGWEDLWVSGGFGQTPGMFINQEGNAFKPLVSQPKQRDALGAATAWHDGLGQAYWLVAASHRLTDPKRTSAVLMFNGHSTEPHKILETDKGGIGSLSVADFDLDGDLDLFIGSTSAFGRYPEPANSQIWINQNGTLQKSETLSMPFASIGHINGSVFFDLDEDERPDLALATEWGSIQVFQNLETGFVNRTSSMGLAPHRGWWTSIDSGDFNGDGRMDLVAGNRGLNTEMTLNQSPQFRIWYGDNDKNGTMETLESWFKAGNWFPVANRTQLSATFPNLPQDIPTHGQFSKTTVNLVLGGRSNEFNHLEANVFESSVFLNRSNGFLRVPLPSSTQESPVYSVRVGDVNGDQAPDIFIGQNKFPKNLDITRYDNGQGFWLLGNANGTFRSLGSKTSGIHVLGEIRDSTLNDFNKDRKPDMTIIQNNGELRLFLGK
ncbi:MAG: VCBS repeat-containing protein [Verrucomicrobia bacterium]|jgi:enediyne biosynthesis protein E4|nr:VCBS repeat-containing protein [Verrucomicrobiota bacterium]